MLHDARALELRVDVLLIPGDVKGISDRGR
jgi:hypothetical protein